MSKPSAQQKPQVLFEPYIKGEVSRISNAGLLTGIALAVIFILMPLAFLAATNSGTDVEIVFVGVWIIALTATLFAEARIRPTAKAGPIQAFAASLALIGVPGLIVSSRGNLNSTLEMTAFIGILLMRLIVLFIILPRSIIESRYPPALLIIRTLLAGAVMTSILTIGYYASQGFSIFVTTRGSFDNWLHPNFTAQLGSICCIMATLDPKMRLHWKASIWGIGLYCMLLTQGRTSLFSTFIILLFVFILEFIHDPKKYSTRAVGYGVAIAIFGTLLTPVLLQLPAIQNIQARNEAVDPLAGRQQYFEAAIEAWQESQIFGFGWRAGVLDNFYAVMLLQTGVVGLLIYLSFFGVIAVRGYKMFRGQGAHTRLLGKFMIVMTFSFIIRSFTEGVHILQLTDLPGNAFCLAAGIAFMLKPVASKWDNDLNLKSIFSRKSL